MRSFPRNAVYAPRKQPPWFHALQIAAVLAAATCLVFGYSVIALFLLILVSPLALRLSRSIRLTRLPADPEDVPHWIGDSCDLLDPMGEIASRHEIEEAGRDRT